MSNTIPEQNNRTQEKVQNTTQENTTKTTSKKNKKEALSFNDRNKHTSNTGNRRTQDMLDALPEIDQTDYNSSSNHDNKQELMWMVT